ncbi:hypothetical protein [Saccharopolyspora phatthalungensis]|uniref:hypothetical protein n=1 Tax=Saccharopolyspora phatthalungensis TaxID=664693 RepID=UPI0035E428C8
MVVGVDGSDGFERVATWAAAEAARQHASLQMVVVIVRGPRSCAARSPDGGADRCGA